MKIWFFIILTLTFWLEARENPFMPVEKNLEYSTNIVIRQDELEKESINLSKTARELMFVELHIKNIDGSKSVQKVQIDKSVDWHKPIIIVHQDVQIIKEKNTKKHLLSFGKPKPFFTLEADNNIIYLTTKDKLIRDFILTNPYRLVFDLKRNARFLTYTQDVTTKQIKKVRLGNHHGYYRIVIDFDSNYKIKKEPKQGNTYLFRME